MDLLARRKLTNKIALGLSMGAMVFGLFWLAWILVTVIQLGIDGLSLSLFTEMTPPPGATGGLRNATVEAGDDCTLIVITRDTLNVKLKKSDPTIRAIAGMLMVVIDSSPAR